MLSHIHSLLFSIVTGVCDCDMSKLGLLSLRNQPAHLNGAYAKILSCSIISSEHFYIFIHENFHFTVFDLMEIFFD